MSQRFIIYFRKEDEIHIMEENKGIKHIHTDINILDKYENKFQILKGYNLSRNGLRDFKRDLKKWNKELLSKENDDRIYYTKQGTHQRATMMIFGRYSTLYKEINLKSPKILREEYTYMDNCFNGGLQYFDKSIKGKVTKSFGYDYSSFYPTNLTKIKIPINKGKEEFLETLPKKLSYGYYRCNVTCDDANIIKVLSFSKNNTYTHFDIKWIRTLKKKYNFNIQINLIHDDKPNAYIYNSEDLLEGRAIFGHWYNKLMKLKKKYPKNRLIKHLLSSLWGTLCSRNIKYVPVDQMDDHEFGLDQIKGLVMKSTGDYYKIEPEDRYRHSIARLKAFLLSYSRCIIGKTVIDNIDDLIRVQTDGVVFTKPIEFDPVKYSSLIPEDKTTGDIKWEHVNSYCHIV